MAPSGVWKRRGGPKFSGDQVDIKRVTHCSPYLTQAQTRRLVALLEANPRKADASLLKKLRAALEKASEGDRRFAEMLDGQRVLREAQRLTRGVR